MMRLSPSARFALISIVFVAAASLLIYSVGFAAQKPAPPPPPSAAANAAPATASQPASLIVAQLTPKSEEAAWRAVERIDEKVANTILTMTVLIALIAFLLGLYEYFKLKEIEKIQEGLKVYVGEQLGAIFKSEFDKQNSDFRVKLTDKLLQEIDTGISDHATQQLTLNTVSHRIMLSYVLNDLCAVRPAPAAKKGAAETPPVMTIERMGCYIELQRAISQLRGPGEDNMAPLALLQSTSQTVSLMTATHILHYMVLVQRTKTLTSWGDREICRDIIRELEYRTGTAANDADFI